MKRDLATLWAAVLGATCRSCILCYWQEAPQCLRASEEGEVAGATEQRTDGVGAILGRQELSSQLLQLIQWEFVCVIWAAQNQLHESEGPALCT